MYLSELEGEGHMLPSWMGSDFDHYRYSLLPALSLVGACGREVRRTELVGDFLIP